jgi:iron complex outermembrane recepter protein
MLKKILYFTLMVLPIVSIKANTIHGTIRDAKTGEGLPAANIYISESNQGTTSDEKGAFTLEYRPTATTTLVAKYVGYEIFAKSISPTADQMIELDIQLVPTALVGKEIIVISTRATAGETPAAFSSLEKEDLDIRYYTQDIPALLSELPSTTFYSEGGNNIGYNYISIRGFGQRRISVMINGIPQNDPEDHNVYWLDFPDFLGNVENIQVQRGAGSAFYGPPAIGGSVNITTSQYSAKPKITGYVGNGSFNTRKYSLALNSGLLKKKYVVFARASQIKSDGFRDRSWTQFKSFFLGAARFGEKSTTRFQVYGGPIEDHLVYYGISKKDALNKNTRQQNPIFREDEIENFSQPHVELIHEYQLSENVKLHNSIFGIRGNGFFDYDGSWAPMSYYRLTPQYGFNVDGNPGDIYTNDLLIRAYVDNKQIGWLPQLLWNTSAGQIIIGAEIRRHGSLHWGRIQKASGELPRGTSQEFSGLGYIGSRRYYEYKGAKDILSPYIHTNLEIFPRTFAMLDIQFAYKKYRLYDEKFIGNDFSLDHKFVNPRFGINYKISPEFHTFASISKTSREPRLKNYYDAAEASTPESWGAVVPQFESNPNGQYNYDSPLVRLETLTDIEFGTGFNSANFVLNVNAFYMTFNDEIVKNGQLDRFGQPITGNADQTHHQGIELQMAAQLAKKFSINANATFSDNELTRHSVFNSAGQLQKLDGNPIAGFPNSMANLRLTYRHHKIQSSIALQHVGKYYTDNFKVKENSVDPYTVFHAMVGYEKLKFMGLESLQLQFHIQNLFDSVYISHGEGSSFFPAAGRNVFLNASFEI